MELEALIRDLTKIEGITWVVGGGSLVSENAAHGMKEPDFSSGYATVEAESWHFHLKVDSVAAVQIVEDEGDDGVPFGFYARLSGAGDETLLRCYFPNPYRDDQGRPAEFQPRRLQVFREFQGRHSATKDVSLVKRRPPSGS